MSSHNHQLMILWAPFLLIHLGGQDTVTAFSLEDNELSLRHLLNLISQAFLVVYVLWKWVALAHYQLVISAALLFVSGIIKYGERIWALKLGSRKGLRTSTSREAAKVSHSIEGSERHPTYQAIVRYAALYTEQGLRDIFAGWKIMDMDTVTRSYFQYRYNDDSERGDARADFKRAEIELSIMYDTLFTKSRVIQKRPGAILWCISLAFLVVAFVLYVKTTIMSSSADGDHRRSRVDAVITYILFIGAFCLEACSFFIVMMSPWEWPFLEARAGWCSVLLTRVAWLIFMRIQPETKPWWSNSMGQYDYVSFCYNRSKSMDKKWSSSVIIAKMAGVFGVGELWNKIHNTKHAQVTRDMKELIHDFIRRVWTRPKRVPSSYRLLLSLPFEQALLTLHIWTQVVVHKAANLMSSSSLTPADKETLRRLMDSCKRLSDYMVYLLVAHPAMLPVRSNLQDFMERAAASNWANPKGVSSMEDFLESLATNYAVTGRFFWKNHISVLADHQSIHAELDSLQQVWLRMLLFAAGKSRLEEHARRLSCGGELFTFVWLLMARRAMGDVDNTVGLIRDGISPKYLFDLEDSAKRRRTS